MNSHFLAAGQQVRPGIFRLFQRLLAGLLLGLAVVPVADGQTVNAKTSMGKAASGKPIRIKNFDKVSTDSLRILLKNPNLNDSSRYFASSKLCGRLMQEGSREALDVTLKNLAYVRKMKHEDFICRALLNTGVYYSQFAEYTEAIKYFNEGIILAEARHWPHLAWRLYNGIGTVEGLNMNDPVKGLKWLNRSLQAQLQVPTDKLSPQMRVSIRYNLANLYSRVKKYDSTYYYVQQALVIAKADHDLTSMGALALLQATSFTYMQPEPAGAMDSAISYMNKSYGYGMESKNYSIAASACLLLSEAWRQKGNPLESQKAAQRALELAQKTHDRDHEHQALQWLAYAYADQGNYKKSVTLGVRAKNLRDSVLNTEKSKEIASLQVQYRVEQLEQRNRLALEQNRAVAAQALAQEARLQLLTQQNRAAAAQQQVQRTSMELLSEQNRASAAEAQTQTARVQLLTQEKRAARLAALQQENNQRARLQSLAIWLGVLGVGLLTGLLLYWRLRRQSARLRLQSELLNEANEKNKQSAAEKEVLLQEIHHRVKNNLEIVNSLLSWQSSALPDPALVEVLRSSQSRIHSMALVHEFLYQAENLSQVRLDEYLLRLLRELHHNLTMPTQRISLTSELEPLVLEAKVAFNFGLLVNELITNALKYAFRGRSSGHLHVELRDMGGRFRLVVSDDGVGMPAAEEVQKNSASLGTKLIHTMARQLKAKLTIEPNLPSGTRVVIAQEAAPTPTLASGERIVLTQA